MYFVVRDFVKRDFNDFFHNLLPTNSPITQLQNFFQVLAQLVLFTMSKTKDSVIFKFLGIFPVELHGKD